MEILDFLEKISNYGFIDLFFGILGLGLGGVIINQVRKHVSFNYKYLHIAPKAGPNLIVDGKDIPASILFELRNSGLDSITIKNAYFETNYKSWKGLWIIPFKSTLEFPPNLDRVKHETYELKFFEDRTNSKKFSEYSTVIKPGFINGVKTVIPLSKAVTEKQIRNRTCGTVIIEYSTSHFGKSGIHKARV